MKLGIQKIVGKTISGTVVGKNNKPPQIQLFLTFTDGTYLEIYGNDFNCESGLDLGDAEIAAGYTKKCGAEITETYLES